MYTTLVDWGQVTRYLVPKIAEYDAKFPPRPPVPLSPATNRFCGRADVAARLQRRMQLPFHAATNRESTMNTLRYLFFHLKCGI